MITYEKGTDLSPSNPVQVTFQSIWAQLIADSVLRGKSKIPGDECGEEFVISVLQRIFNSMPSKPDTAELEEEFWKWLDITIASPSSQT